MTGASIAITQAVVYRLDVTSMRFEYRAIVVQSQSQSQIECIQTDRPGCPFDSCLSTIRSQNEETSNIPNLVSVARSDPSGVRRSEVICPRSPTVSQHLTESGQF
jgi:rRNA-processing protein FCF1